MFFNPMRLIRKFHKAFGYSPDNSDAALDLRIDLIREEAYEVCDALYGYLASRSQKNREHVAKELADLLVVTFGTFDALGLPAEKSFREVMRSNMSKLGPDGKPILREDGKFLKGPGYVEADMHGVLTGEWR